MINKENFPFELNEPAFNDLFDENISPERKKTEINYLIHTQLREWKTQPVENREKWVRDKLEEIIAVNRNKKRQLPAPISKPVINTTNQTSPTNQAHVAIPTVHKYQFNLDRTAYAEEKAKRSEARKLAQEAQAKAEKLRQDKEVEDLKVLAEIKEVMTTDPNYKMIIDIFTGWISGNITPEARKIISQLHGADYVNILIDLYPTMPKQYYFVQKVLSSLPTEMQTPAPNPILVKFAKKILEILN